jgi:hypothetical protein
MSHIKRMNRPLRTSALEHAAMQAKMLVDFLNSPDIAGHAGVLEILQLCQRLHELRKTAPAVYPKDATDANWTFMSQRDSLLKAVNEILRPFQFTPRLDGGLTASGRYSVDWRALITSRSKASVIPGTGATVIPAIRAIKLVTDMLTSGMLDRVRCCAFCARWFFAHTNKKKSCGGRCRKEKCKQSAAQTFKKHRASYMREYRRIKKRQKVVGARRKT